MSPQLYHNMVGLFIELTEQVKQSNSMGPQNRTSQNGFSQIKTGGVMQAGASQTKPNSPVNPNIGGLIHRPASSSNSRQPHTAGANSAGNNGQYQQTSGIYLGNMAGQQKRVPTASKNIGGSPLLNSPNSTQPLVVGRNKILSSTQPIITLKSMKRGGEPVNQQMMRTGGDNGGGKGNYTYFY